MAEKTPSDILSVNVDSNETKVLNATVIDTFKSISPNGQIIFDSTEAIIPGTLSTTASFSTSSSYAVLANTATSASYALTASYLEGTITSASYALTASLALKASGSLTGSLLGTASTASLALEVSASSINSNGYVTFDSSNINSIDWNIRKLVNTAGDEVLNWSNKILKDDSGNESIDWQNREVYDESFQLAIKYDNTRELYDETESISLNWKTRALVDKIGTTTLDWSTDNTILINGDSIITGSVAIGTELISGGENNLVLGPAPAGGRGEGGQIAFLAAGGSYTSSSFIDNWQDQLRILRGYGDTSDAGLVYVNLRSGDTKFIGAVTASAYNGLPNDYLYVTRNTTQTIGSGTWADRDIIFNNSVVSKGISYNTGTGLASLTGGKVYRITARLAWSAAAAYLLEFSCYNSSNTQLGPTVQIVQSTNSSNNISDGTLDFIYAPGSNVDIKIRTTNNTNALTGESIRGDLNTQLIIQQIA